MPDRAPDLVLPLWSDVPAKRGQTREDNPWLEVFHPEKPTGAAVLVCPGGGYGERVPHESAVMAYWLNTLGVTGIIVHYRVFPYKHPQPLNDLSQAMRLTRKHAAEWGIDPARVGVLGASAGGHLVSTLCTHFDPDTRPDVAILLYPVITFRPPSLHAGSRDRLLENPADPALCDLLSNELHVTPNTPPTFIFHTVEDVVVPVENALMYAAALQRNKVPFELHLYEPGEHGVALANDRPGLATWKTLCANWLRLRNFVD